MRTREEVDVKPGEFLDFGFEALFCWATPSKPETITDYPGFGPPIPGGPFNLPLPIDRALVIEFMRHYSAFGWTKIENHRGISASRTVDKMRAWCWLLGDEDEAWFAAMEEQVGYAMYGAPILAAVCRRFDFPIPTGDWIDNMRTGRPCTPDCVEGCL